MDQFIMTILTENQTKVMIHIVNMIPNAIQIPIVNTVNAAHNGDIVELVNLILYKLQLIAIVMTLAIPKRNTLENAIVIMIANQEIVKL